ncbi:DUF4214 domain-containing protein [Telluria beijingensis]|uniref:DUF4214 domain-containing protein n=1 Tax=Telluria beijingensis TaxID=3068633 RepID=UPI0027952F8E|nr:DUF4214 domain-containing protein [Massilia sp. REN29]
MNESTNYNSTVHSFYLAFLGRPADAAGLKFWSEHLTSVNGDLGIIAESFANSEEAQTRFGDDTPAERIVQIYQQLFNRGPEPAGLVFWTNAIEQGHVTLADVAISILEGAQGTDASLALLREQAVADFTAQVEASGTDYDGYAAIEAARVLVRAVTPGASQDDIARAVKAAVAFTDTASTNPSVIDAIATGSTLQALFDTARGLKDPVTLVQALADVAEAAAGNPATLESLLRGGGMAKVLEVMPSRASLQDVVDALAEGGLPAAIDVVYPPRPTTPPAAGVKFTFEGVTHGDDDRAPDDNVTSERVVDVEFSFTGALKSGEKFQYTVDGGEHWHDITPSGNRLIIPEINLADGELVDGGGDKRMALKSIDGDYVTTVQVRVANANNGTVTSKQEKITWDQTPPDGYVEFVRIDGGQDGDQATNRNEADVTFSVDYLDDGFVQWRIKGDDKWIDVGKVDNSGNFTLRDIDLSEDDPTIEVRVIDAAGNVGHENEWKIDGPAGNVLKITPMAKGLQIASSITGTIELGGSVVVSSAQGGGILAGIPTMVGEQLVKTQGTFTIVPTAGLDLSDKTNTVYALGTAAGETLKGENLWGFGGDDTLFGTDGDDLLVGGDGNDTIHSNGGEDSIIGGAGADWIILDAKNDGVTRIGFEQGDAYTGEVKDGVTVANLDRISGAKAGDQLFFSSTFNFTTPTVSDQYLTTTTSGQMSIVRGTMSGGSFFVDAQGSAHIMQWTDGKNINSFVVTDFGGASGIDLEFSNQNGFVTLVNKPVSSSYVGTEFLFGAETSRLVLKGNPSDVAQVDEPGGLLDMSGFALKDVVTGDSITPLYASGVDFGVQQDGSLRLGSTLQAGVYEMSWDAKTFATDTGGFSAGKVQFAGGADGLIVQQGFEYKSEIVLTNPQSNYGTDTSGRVYRTDLASTTLITGNNKDIVLAESGTVSLQYRTLDGAAQDLVIGFGEDDQVQFATTAMVTINRNAGMTIEWAQGADNTGRVVATQAHEGAFIETEGLIASDELDVAGSDTLATLNAHLNISALADDEGLLILAHDKDGSGGALMYFLDLDDNGAIDAGEVELVAMFAEGVPNMEQVILVGFG